MSTVHRLSTAGSSAAETDYSDNDDDLIHGKMIPVKNHGTQISVHEGDFICPSIEDVNKQIERFEKKRLEFNLLQLQYINDSLDGTEKWNRKKAIVSLAAFLKRMALRMAESLAFRPEPVTTTTSWFGVETDEQNYELCYSANGLNVWKKDFGNARVIVRGDFVVPVTPKQYCQYASDITRRQEWDQNVSEVRKVEQIAEGIDITYVAIQRIATIYPRDYINIRVINEVKCFGRLQRRSNLRRHSTGETKSSKNELRRNSSTTSQNSEKQPITQSTSNNKSQSEKRSNGFKEVAGDVPAKENSISSEIEHESKTVTNAHSTSPKRVDFHSSESHSRVHVSRHGCWCSCSCSLEHPELREMQGKVRADVKVACYIAQPIYLANKLAQSIEQSQTSTSEIAEAIKEAVSKTSSENTSDGIGDVEIDPVYHNDPRTTTVWSRVYMFSEIDPKGWLPATMSKHLAARVLPRTVEHIVTCMLDHYRIPWRNEQIYDPDEECWKKCDNALEYCYFKYLYALEE